VANPNNGVVQQFNGMIPNMRAAGASLQEIGNYCGVSRERVRQVLGKFYPSNLYPSRVLTREQVARLLGCSGSFLAQLEKRGILHPMRLNRRNLYYRISDLAQTKVIVQEHRKIRRRLPDIELTCEYCGKVFYRRRVNVHSPGRFCSHKCQGKVIGQVYGFAVNPQNARTRHSRKWDYELVYKARDQTGWGGRRLSRMLGIPKPTIEKILSLRGRSSPSAESEPAGMAQTTPEPSLPERVQS